jgi:Carboxypeptidase regulatory-like domain
MLARPACAAVVTALLCTCVAMGDGIVRASGVVKDSSGDPISGALVFFDHPSRERWPKDFESRSRSDGSFDVSPLVAPGRYTVPLVVRAEGFKPVSVDLPTLVRNKVEVRLARLDSSATSMAAVTTER